MCLFGMGTIKNIHAANFYFDVNGATSGSGVIDGGTYSWENAVWNNNVSAGNVATINYADGNFPRFAAASDATGSYTVTMNANHLCVGMILEDGSVGSTLTINGIGTLFINGGVAQGFIVRGGSNVKIVNSLSGTGGVNFQTSGGTGSGSLYLYGFNSYSGGTVLNTAGGLNFNNDNSFGTGAITWNVASQVIADPDAIAPITLGNAMITRAASTLTYIGPASAPVTFTNNWTLASGTSTLFIGNAAFPSSQMTISGAVGGTGASFTKTGVGMLILSGTNTYDGGTTLDNGAIALGNKAALGTNNFTIGGATAAPSISLSATTNLTGENAVANAVIVTKDFTVSGASDLELSGPINLGSTDRMIAVTNTGTTIFSGAIGGSGGLIKDGSGTLTLSGSNSFTGGTTINGGGLSGGTIANSGANSAFGQGNFTLNNAGLVYTGGTASTDPHLRTRHRRRQHRCC